MSLLLSLFAWLLLGLGAYLIGGAMALGSSKVKLAGIKINAVFWGFFSFVTGLVLMAFITY